MSADHKHAPHSVEAEQAVLGGLLLDNSAMDKIAGWLYESDFYRSDHRAIWRSISNLLTKGGGANIVTVYDYLVSIDKAEDAGGLAYLNAIASSTPGAAGIKGYAAIVKDRALRRAMMVAMQEGYEIASSTGSRTVTEMAAEVEKKVFDLTERLMKASSDLPSVADVLPQVKADMQERMESGGPVYGIRSGLRELDNTILGFHANQLIIVGGRPSMGKTALAMQAATHAAMNLGHVVGVFSMEMSAKQLVSRMAAAAAEIDLMDIRRGTLDKYALERWREMEHTLAQAPIYIDDRAALTPIQMRATLRRMKREHGLDLVVVDHIGLASGEGKERHHQISSITKALKAMAKEFNIPVIALSQINRAVDKQAFKRPALSDLKESGAIEEDADVVMFLYREEFYNPDTPNRGVAEIIVAKQRDGPPDLIYTEFIGRFAKFKDTKMGYRPIEVGTASAPRGFD